LTHQPEGNRAGNTEKMAETFKTEIVKVKDRFSGERLKTEVA
jgi:hypothetical protein